MGQQFGNRMLNLQIKKLKSNKVNKYQVRAERERERERGNMKWIKTMTWGTAWILFYIIRGRTTN